MNENYYEYLKILAHVLKLDKSGNIDKFALDTEHHNGPKCINCKRRLCNHCDDKTKYFVNGILND